jgi:hypothetical protein
MHHGHLQGANKCKGDRKWCATCLKAGHQHEDTATHTAHECTVAREVWAKLARAWEEATGESLDVSHPRLTVLGLRPTPPQTATPHPYIPLSLALSHSPRERKRETRELSPTSDFP